MADDLPLLEAMQAPKRYVVEDGCRISLLPCGVGQGVRVSPRSKNNPCNTGQVVPTLAAEPSPKGVHIYRLIQTDRPHSGRSVSGESEPGSLGDLGHSTPIPSSESPPRNEAFSPTGECDGVLEAILLGRGMERENVSLCQETAVNRVDLLGNGIAVAETHPEPLDQGTKRGDSHGHT